MLFRFPLYSATYMGALILVMAFGVFEISICINDFDLLLLACGRTIPLKKKNTTLEIDESGVSVIWEYEDCLKHGLKICL